jgi:hypothetical protein
MATKNDVAELNALLEQLMTGNTASSGSLASRAAARAVQIGAEVQGAVLAGWEARRAVAVLAYEDEKLRQKELIVPRLKALAERKAALGIQ